jgi:hypothetical protein
VPGPAVDSGCSFATALAAESAAQTGAETGTGLGGRLSHGLVTGRKYSTGGPEGNFFVSIYQVRGRDRTKTNIRVTDMTGDGG